MVIGKKKRDVKFIIYQSLYILVIAMLGAKHVTINDIPDALKEGDTVVKITKLDSLNRLLDSLSKLHTYDPVNQIVLKKPENESFQYKILSDKETIISLSDLENYKRVQQMKTPIKPSRENPPPQDPGVLIPDQ